MMGLHTDKITGSYPVPLSNELRLLACLKKIDTLIDVINQPSIYVLTRSEQL